MIGLIWFVQVVHYPLFAVVGESGYKAYQLEHMRLTTFVVMPVMLIELATAAALVFLAIDRIPWMFFVANASLLGLIWLSTFFIQVPVHEQLVSGLNEQLVQKLVSGNWIRTVLWSARGLMLLWAVWYLMQPQLGSSE
ncbi:MAG: hypothetical protein ACFCU1_07095 [Sumerlaeia bacterium]